MQSVLPTDLDAAFASEIQSIPDRDLIDRRRQLDGLLKTVPYDSHAWREGHRKLDTMDYVLVDRVAHGQRLNA